MRVTDDSVHVYPIWKMLFATIKLSPTKGIILGIPGFLCCSSHGKYEAPFLQLLRLPSETPWQMLSVFTVFNLDPCTPPRSQGSTLHSRTRNRLMALPTPFHCHGNSRSSCSCRILLSCNLPPPPLFFLSHKKKAQVFYIHFAKMLCSAY